MLDQGTERALLISEKHLGKIHLLLTDVIMPRMNGRELAETARSLRPELKVLYTTGYSRNAITHNGVLDPHTYLLAKPFTVDALAAKLAQVLAD